MMIYCIDDNTGAMVVSVVFKANLRSNNLLNKYSVFQPCKFYNTLSN
jgi:hypothetical protein